MDFLELVGVGGGGLPTSIDICILGLAQINGECPRHQNLTGSFTVRRWCQTFWNSNKLGENTVSYKM